MNKRKWILICIGPLMSVFLITGIIYLNLTETISIKHRIDPIYRFLDQNGKLIRVHKDENAVRLVSLDKIPLQLIELTLEAEDNRFYSHGGIDFLALSRALVQNIIQMRQVSGASTISQQVARLAFNYKRTIWNKPFVMLHSLKLEKKYTKGELLEFYFNLIPFGHKVIGIGEGSIYFFGKTLSELSLAEMASLVVLIRAPSRYSSNKYKLKLIKKRNALLNKSHFDKEKVRVAIKEDWFMAKKTYKARSPYYMRALLKRFPLAYFKDQKIHTALDLRLQEEVQDIVTQKMIALKEKGVTAASVLVLDNKNGNILAYIGNHDFFSPDGGEYDGIQIPRQPGSTIKPFTYALALETGKTLSDILPDIELYFKAGIGSFKPRNYSLQYSGPRTMREALGNSLNIPALYLTDQLGVTRLANFLNKFGLKINKSADYFGIGLTLGNAEFTLLQMTAAYMAFANKGTIWKPRFLLNEKPVKIKVPMTVQTAELITDVLSDSHSRKESFGEYSLLDTKFSSAAKTGTSTLYRDNWVLGYTPRFTIGVWVGNMNQKEMHNVSGITGAGPIYQDVINTTRQYYHSKSFTKKFKYEKREICSISGKIATRFCPRTYTEIYRQSKAPKEKCKIHFQVLVRNCFMENDLEFISVKKYPPIYFEWSMKSSVGTINSQVKDYCLKSNYEIISKVNGYDGKFRIISPVQNSLYAIDPDIPIHLQKIHFNTNMPEGIKQIRWFVNKKRISLIGPESIFKWQVKKGRYQIEGMAEYENGDLQTDTVILDVL